MTGSDETTQPYEHPGRAASDDRRRDSIVRAEPTPVTEAMIMPRTVPVDPEEAAEIEGRICYTCGELNDPGGSVCLACGALIVTPEPDPEPDDAVDTSDNRTEETLAPERTRPSGVTGVEEQPVSHWEETEKLPGLRSRSSSSRRGVRLSLIMIVVIAVLILGFDMLRNRGTAPVDTEPATTLPASPPSEAEEDPLRAYALRAYADRLSDIADDAEELAAAARRINDDWGDRSSDYATTFEGLAGLAPQAEELSDRLEAVPRPEDADAAAHRRMVEALSSLTSSAEGMVAGLQSSDSGETRLEQLAEFENAATEFRRLADRAYS